MKKHIRPAFGDIRAAEFSTSHIRRYVAERLKDGATNATINRELEVLERAFRLASECEPPKVARMIHVRLRRILPEYLRPIFVVAYHVGNRAGELLRLGWPQVDFANSQILLNPGTTKNRKGRGLPIYGDMRELLLIEKEIRDTRFPGCQ